MSLFICVYTLHLISYRDTHLPHVHYTSFDVMKKRKSFLIPYMFHLIPYGNPYLSHVHIHLIWLYMETYILGIFMYASCHFVEKHAFSRMHLHTIWFHMETHIFPMCIYTSFDSIWRDTSWAYSCMLHWISYRDTLSPHMHLHVVWFYMETHTFPIFIYPSFDCIWRHTLWAYSYMLSFHLI